MLRSQYQRAMAAAYAFAREAARGNTDATDFLDCGCGQGQEWEATFAGEPRSRPGFAYTGLEWNPREAAKARARGLHVLECDLNEPLPVQSRSVDCVIAYSVVEHLLMPCHFMGECLRVLRPGGRLVVLTPNIATYFTAALVLAGRMPSSGPHPDSNSLAAAKSPVRVSHLADSDRTEKMPEHRHLVVFSFLALRGYLRSLGLVEVAARGYGYYPLPKLLQPLFERLDPWHCHQMVLVYEKPAEPA
jgi:SAM-dependent methyltransferase